MYFHNTFEAVNWNPNCILESYVCTSDSNSDSTPDSTQSNSISDSDSMAFTSTNTIPLKPILILLLSQ